MIVTLTALYGGSGSDQLSVGNGDGNLLDGGDGADILQFGGGAMNRLYGGAGNDRLDFGGGDGNRLSGGEDNDWLRISGGNNNILLGDAGDDQLLYGGGDNNTVDGGDGADTIQFSNGGNSNRLFGGAGDDQLYFAGGGQNLIDMGAGNDTATVVGYGATVIYGRDGNDNLTLNYGTALIDAGTGNDTVQMGSGAQFVFGGTGDDTLIDVGDGDVVGFNKGDGQDNIMGNRGGAAVLSLGAGIRYDDLLFSRSDDNLILSMGAGDSVTLSNWFSAGGSHAIATLQVITRDGDYDIGSSDALKNQKIQTFDFGTLVSAFEQAAQGATQFSNWAVSQALLSAHLTASNDAAIGGDLAFQYALSGAAPSLQLTAIQAVLSQSGFGRGSQPLST